MQNSPDFVMYFPSVFKKSSQQFPFVQLSFEQKINDKSGPICTFTWLFFSPFFVKECKYYFTRWSEKFFYCMFFHS